ncbi:O-Antigen Polymerase family protein [Listeria grandensis FSL F6-0971]|uniref:O-Antigen polymerase family protein n=2 Tax=Listeria grandensis TaxID=1494963 RepID=W7BSS0_9LIST|nr:O-Antigen Polymerase family protein [Listeria grandensis FSL F6-0971]
MQNRNGIQKKSLLISFLFLSVITPFFPALIGVLVIIILLYSIRDIPFQRINYYLFIGVVISGFFGPYLALPEFPSIFLFRVLIILHMICFLLEKKDFNKLGRVKIPLLLFAIWILYSIMSLLWTSAPALSLTAIYYQIESFYLILAFVYYIDNFAKLKQVVIWMVGIYVLTIFIGLGESFTGHHLKYSAGNILSYGDTRPTGLLVNTNDYSSYLAFYVPFLMLCLFQKRSGLKMCTGIGALMALTFLILQTESRSGLVAFAVVVVLTLYKLFAHKVLFFFGVFMTAFASLTLFLVKNSAQVNEYFHGKVNSTNQRIFIYETIWRLCQEHHYLGVGIGVTPKFVFTALYGTANIPMGMQQTMSAHNLWLSNLSDVGLLGIFPFILCFLWFLIHAMKVYAANQGLLSATPLCILIAFMAISVGSSSIFEMRVVWLGMGLALTIIHLLTKEREKKYEQAT